MKSNQNSRVTVWTALAIAALVAIWIFYTQHQKTERALTLIRMITERPGSDLSEQRLEELEGLLSQAQLQSQAFRDFKNCVFVAVEGRNNEFTDSLLRSYAFKVEQSLD